MPSAAAEELFERGKSYFDDKKFEEALMDFSELVRLEPDNADYHAWLARTFLNMGKLAEALAPANQALELDPLCQLAYRVRGGIHLRNKEYQKAIQDYSQAIQLDPQDYQSFQERGLIYWRLGDYENALTDQARYYRLYPDWDLFEWFGQNAELQAKHGTDLWYRTIHQHLTANLLSRLRVGDEKFVGYWPCLLEWGKETRWAGMKGTYAVLFGTYGTGYLCLTSKNIYLISIGQLTKQFPLFKRGIFASPSVSFREPEKNDKFWTVPYQSIIGAHMAENQIMIILHAMTWEVYEHFTGQLQEILTGINLGRTGRFDPVEVAKPQIQEIIMGNKYSFGNISGSNVNVDSTLERVTQSIGNLPRADSETREALAKLISELKENLKQAPPEQSQTAEKIADRVDSLIKEASKEKPDQEVAQFSLESLKKAAENISAVIPTVLPIATEIATQIGKLLH
jgi:tetratricopeptide (TPR) repeat protein